MDDEFRDQVVSLMPRLRAHATVLMRSSVDADDLLQDVMVRAWKFRHTFRPGTNLAAWLFRIMRNQFLTQIRRTTYARQYSGEDWRTEFSTLPDQEWKCTYNELLGALQQISEPSRQALLLVSACGLTYEEAAYVCDCAPGTIKSRVSRARDRVAELMGGRHFDGAIPAPAGAVGVAA